MPLLLALDPDRKYDCCFTYDPEKQAWQVRFEERRESTASVSTAKAAAQKKAPRVETSDDQDEEEQ